MPSLNGPTSFNILTFNCWGIPPIMGISLSSDYYSRMDAISKVLQHCDHYDVICFQELWSTEQYEKFKSHANLTLPYSHYFYSGAIGSGMCIFSKWPITDTFFHKWQLNGYIHKIQHADWFGGKGIGLCCVNVNGLRVNVYTAHLHAMYSKTSDDDEYAAHRVIQAFDTAQFIRLTSHGAHISVLGADLNSEPDDICYQLILHNTRMRDSFMEGEEATGTFGCRRNTYSTDKHLPNGQRIDHILYNSNSHYEVECSEYNFPFGANVPNQKFSFSDHEAVCVKLMVTKKLALISSPEMETWITETENDYLMCSLKKGIEVCEQALRTLQREKMRYYIFSFFSAVSFSLIFFYFNVLRDQFGNLWPTMSFTISVALLFFSFFFAGLFGFFFLMAIIWNKQERNGIMDGMQSMKLLSSNIKRVFVVSEES